MNQACHASRAKSLHLVRCVKTPHYISVNRLLHYGATHRVRRDQGERKQTETSSSRIQAGNLIPNKGQRKGNSFLPAVVRQVSAALLSEGLPLLTCSTPKLPRTVHRCKNTYSYKQQWESSLPRNLSYPHVALTPKTRLEMACYYRKSPFYNTPILYQISLDQVIAGLRCSWTRLHSPAFPICPGQNTIQTCSGGTRGEKEGSLSPFDTFICCRHQ